MPNIDKNNPLWGILGFFFPAAGLVLFLVWRSEQPKDARHALRGAVAGLVIGIGVRVAAVIIFLDRLI